MEQYNEFLCIDLLYFIYIRVQNKEDKIQTQQTAPNFLKYLSFQTKMYTNFSEIFRTENRHQLVSQHKTQQKKNKTQHKK